MGTNEKNVHYSKVISPGANSSKVKYVQPWSKCRLTFIAAYNPASLDTGIRHIVITRMASKFVSFTYGK